MVKIYEQKKQRTMLDKFLSEIIVNVIICHPHCQFNDVLNLIA